MKKIFLAGGCFWGLEAYFEKLKGILKTDVGYANSLVENPSYAQVCTGTTGAVEAMVVYFDSNELSLERLLEHFFLNIDPTTLDRQGNDIGSQYRTGIYYENPEDLSIIEKVIKKEAEKYSAPIVTEVLPIKNFYIAEEEHQHYLNKNPGGYCHNRHAILHLKNSPDYNGK